MESQPCEYRSDSVAKGVSIYHETSPAKDAVFEVGDEDRPVSDKGQSAPLLELQQGQKGTEEKEASSQTRWKLKKSKVVEEGEEGSTREMESSRKTGSRWKKKARREGRKKIAFKGQISANAIEFNIGEICATNEHSELSDELGNSAEVEGNEEGSKYYPQSNRSDANAPVPQLDLGIVRNEAANGDKSFIVEELCNAKNLVDPATNEQLPRKIPLPFMKMSPIWESFESMEAFQRLPQNPHFIPLQQCLMECREGMAIGHMVNFANLVTLTRNAHVSDVVNVYEARLDALNQLEQHGFDVEPPRARLLQLLELRQRHEQSLLELAALDTKVIEKGLEIDELDLEIINLDMDVLLLKESIIHIRESLAILFCQYGRKKSEITDWVKQVEVKKAECIKVEGEFERLVTELQQSLSSCDKLEAAV